MRITNAVVHLIEKGRNQPSKVKLRNEELPQGERLTELVENLRHLYNEKSGHGYGVFQQDQNAYPLSRLLAGNHTSTWDFLDFTKTSLGVLKQRIDKEAFATGGYVLFVGYEESGNRFLLVATLKNKKGLGFDENLNLSDTKHIDLEHLHEMARINLTIWADNGQRYLSFAKKKSQDEFSQYFREFIGCDEFTESRHLTKTLLEAIKDYCSIKKLGPDAEQLLREKTYNYCEEKYQANDQINLTALSARFDDDEPLAFIEYVNTNSGKYQLSDGFEPDRKTYKRLKRFMFRSSGFSISFEADMINKTVIYNKDARTLTITDLPENFYDQISEY